MAKTFNPASLMFRLPLYIFLFCAILCIANGLIGYRVFKALFEEQYETITRQIAYTALSYLDGDSIAGYAAGKPADEAWTETDRKLNVLTRTSDLAYIYDTVHPQVVNGKVIPLGRVSSLKKHDEKYIANLKQVMLEGKPYIKFSYNKTGGHVTTSIPVADSSGGIVGILSVVKPMSEVDALKDRYLRTTFILSALLTVLFVTCWMGILTLSTGDLVFANAGHTSPVIFHEGRVEYLTDKPNLMLAGMQGMKYKEHHTQLAPGDRIFVYTDGVTEATNAANELYGENRLILCMANKRTLSAKELLEAVRDDVNQFVGSAPQFDDITMLELSIKDMASRAGTQAATGAGASQTGADSSTADSGAGTSTTASATAAAAPTNTAAAEAAPAGGTRSQTKIFDATDENMGPVNDFVHAMLPENCPVEILNKLDLAVEEVYINIAHYAYKPVDGTVEISCTLEQAAEAEGQDGGAGVQGASPRETTVPRLTICFKDRGKPFDPLAREDPDITLSAEDRGIGGLGIFLTKKFMDSVTYAYEDGQNILTMSKTLA